MKQSGVKMSGVSSGWRKADDGSGKTEKRSQNLPLGVGQISQSIFKAADEAKKTSGGASGESYGQQSHARKLTNVHRVPEKSSRDILKAEIFQFQNGKQLQFDCGLAQDGRAAEPKQSRRRKTCAARSASKPPDRVWSERRTPSGNSGGSPMENS